MMSPGTDDITFFSKRTNEDFESNLQVRLLPEAILLFLFLMDRKGGDLGLKRSGGRVGRTLIFSFKEARTIKIFDTLKLDKILH